MENNMLFIVILVLSSVTLGTILGIVITLLRHKWGAKRYRIQHDIPNIIGKWRCQWFDDSSDKKEPKIEDTVDIQKWTNNGEFIARGFQPNFHLNYPLVGEIDPSRVVTFIYKAARYPYEPNRGVACMELSRDGKTMEGQWFGRRFSGQLGGGHVKCLRIDEPKILV